MTTFEPAANLRSRTFLGLLIAQFFAAFNDQAIHASAMFFALRTRTLSERTAIALMPILFYAPWALFCTLAGYFADRYSKRNSLVFWKIAEVGITGLALAGFWFGTHGNHWWGPWIVLSTVFLMGLHSAFFVPAKYGAMPEILKPEMLSRGNGLLESLSFLAIILGTVFGGVLSTLFHDNREHVIGIVLFVLAIIGALASFLIRRMPAANPSLSFPPFLYKPLFENIRLLLRSRPCAFAVVGIAFFTFIVAFMRATVYMHGQSQVPRWSEQDTSIVVGMVALGIGIGSPLVGFLSGRKVELGMVPIGAVGMILAIVAATYTLTYIPGLIACIIAIGFFTGFYIVPLFTLLQHRAPRTSKGYAIATSNFINVTGAILASLVFYGIGFAAEKTGIAPVLTPRELPIEGALTENPKYHHGRVSKVVIDDKEYATGDRQVLNVLTQLGRSLEKGDQVVVEVYQVGETTVYNIRRADQQARPFHDQRGMPRLLFVSAAAMTLVTLLLLWWQLPDLGYRTWLWYRWQKRYRLDVEGLDNLPDSGPVILVTNAEEREAVLQVLSVTDRTTRFLKPDANMKKARRALRHGEVVGVLLPEVEQLLDELGADGSAPVVPTYYATSTLQKDSRKRVHIIFGPALPPGSSAQVVAEELHRLGEAFRKQQRDGAILPEALSGTL
jgi:MFS family permease